ncbi:nSTAND1 domain-containing NTPase [Spirosoma pollinicola]|uniref:Novel STAND NTPase 1 domain-containing protein n=1 Tax=Spirosoma pollinicola TaxID=2057025 RepID=A0A2K8Z0D7_9BACT|nr:WD40 repeat domain-containing protein [Spirosoma pollinicola]AUD03347.1 hypothetical protein CWM47_16805 [Spirosoma pollinicola]
MDTSKVDVLQDRYPGLRSFTGNEQNLFFGRKKEIDDLLDLVRAEQITVLFAKSGLGKSSLLNAGLAPKLRPLHYQIIPVRLQKQKNRTDDDSAVDQQATLSDNVLLNIVLTQLHGEFKTAWQGQTEPDCHNDFNTAPIPQLWEEVKTHPFPNGAIPVFMFDQFEELFLYDQQQQNDFIDQLAELMNDQSPFRIMQWLLKTDFDDRTPEMMAWSKQPLVKCLFAIRADRLFEMHKLRGKMPMILRNRYELLPLIDDRAREAIDKPAQADGQFNSPKFTFKDYVRESIIRVLSGNKNTKPDELPNEHTDRPELCEIESSQLQIVCNYIETKIKEKVAQGQEPVVDRDIIHNDQSINRILDKFYRTQLTKIGSPQEIDKVRTVLENDLIVDGHRVGLAAAKMRKSLGDDKTADQLIDKLIEVRLIRADDTHLGRTYELSHDTLIEPVEKVKQLRTALQNRIAGRREAAEQLLKLREQEAKFNREKQQRKRFQRLTLWLFILAFIAFGASFAAIHFLVNGRINLANANNDWGSDEYTAGNQRMAYRLWESSENLLKWIPCSKSLIPCTKDDLDARTRTYMMVPFSGATTQFTVQDTTIHYVASLFQNNSLEVWQPAHNPSNTDSSLYEKIDWLYDSLNVTSATRLQLRNNYLIVFQHDSLLQVLDLQEKKKVFPLGKGYYPLLTSAALASRGTRTHTENSVLYAAQTVVLPPKGNWLAAIDCQGQAHLYNLNEKFSPNKFFERYTNQIPDFTLDNLTFASSEDFMLVNHPGKNQYDLLNLRKDQLLASYPNTVYARFSPTGKYLITLNSSGQLTIVDVVTQKRQTTVRLPNPTMRINDLIFNRNESALVIVTRPEVTGKASAPGVYSMFRVDLTQTKTALNTIAQAVNTHLSFGLAGHVLYTSHSLSYNYNINTGNSQLFSFPLNAVAKTGAAYLMYTQIHSAAKNSYLYNVVTGRQTDISRLSTGSSERYVFYAPPNGIDSKLIRVTPKQLAFFEISQLERGLTNKPDVLNAGDSTLFQPASLRMAGPLIKVKNQHDVVLYFFVDNKKNQLNYVVNRIYPKLTKSDRDAAGLPD